MTHCLDPAKLRAARGDRTQQQIADAAGLHQSAYARIESGDRPDPQLSTAVKVAEALGTTVDLLIVGQRARDSRAARD